MKPGFGKALLKWALCVLSICSLYCLVDTVGLFFGVALSYVIIEYM